VGVLRKWGWKMLICLSESFEVLTALLMKIAAFMEFDAV
jgi:hypothetical protein